MRYESNEALLERSPVADTPPTRLRLSVEPKGTGDTLRLWVGKLRQRFGPSRYVDWADTPEEPTSPYRARLFVNPAGAEEEAATEGREVVHGTVKMIYEVRCECGRRWFHRKYVRVQVCPRCDRAVLIERP